MPLVGLDEVIGLLFVRSSATEYTEEHLRALSVVAAKLAAYITIRGASAELAELARERDEARRAVEAASDAKDELLALVSRSSGSLLLPTGDRALDELDQRIQAQAQRLDDLLGQARLASAELRLTLRKVAPALLERGSVVTWRLEAARAAGLIETGTRARPAAARPTDAKTSSAVIWCFTQSSTSASTAVVPTTSGAVTLPVGSMVQRSVRRSASTSSARSCLPRATSIRHSARGSNRVAISLSSSLSSITPGGGGGERNGGGRRHGRFVALPQNGGPDLVPSCATGTLAIRPVRSGSSPFRPALWACAMTEEHAATDTTVPIQSAIFILRIVHDPTFDFPA